MSGVPKIEIAESVEELKLLMKQQKTGVGYAKVQSLYLGEKLGLMSPDATPKIV